MASTRGLEGVTFGDLATDLGLSKSGLFAHFKSKEQLQLDVLSFAADRFTQSVFVPALKRARGEERLAALFEGWLEWIRSGETSQGCVFLSGAVEWDDREGPVRQCLVQWFEELYRSLARAVRLAVDERQFRADLDTDQFASEMHALALKFHLDARLLRRRRARTSARRGFERLCEDARVARKEGRNQ